MATEPESMAAVKLALENVTLIGDHMQLQVRHFIQIVIVAMVDHDL